MIEERCVYELSSAANISQMSKTTGALPLIEVLISSYGRQSL